MLPGADAKKGRPPLLNVDASQGVTPPPDNGLMSKRSVSQIQGLLHPSANVINAKEMVRKASGDSLQGFSPRNNSTCHVRLDDVEVPVGIEHVDTLSFGQKVFYMLDGIPEDLMRSSELLQWRKPTAMASYIHIGVVVFSSLLFCVDSFPEFEMKDSSAPVVNHLIAFVLSFELLVRLVTTPDRKLFLSSQWTWVDFISVFPYYIALIVEAAVGMRRSFVFTRLARGIRAIRIIRLGRQSLAIRAFYKSIGKSTSGLGLLLFLFSILVIVGSAMVYVAEMTISTFDEHRNMWIYDSDGKENPFASVIHTSWFIIVSITTVGYGDMVVRSPTGKAITSCILLLGPFVIAFPTVILSANFADSHASLKDASTEKSKTTSAMPQKSLDAKKVREVEYFPFAKSITEYRIAPGATSRAISLKNNVAFYDPLLVLRCRNDAGEDSYGFQSTSSAHVKVRDNFPSGVVVRFFLLLHTELAQKQAVLAVQDFLRDFPTTKIDCVAPRPIRILRVSFSSNHHALQQARVVCNKYTNPFGTVSLDLHCREEALPVLLRFPSTCTFTFKVEFNDSAASQMVSLDIPVKMENESAESMNMLSGTSMWL